MSEPLTRRERVYALGCAAVLLVSCILAGAALVALFRLVDKVV